MKSLRDEGGIQPGIKWWKFTIRIPGIHTKLNWSMAIQGGLIHIGFAAAATALVMKYFGMPFEVAWSMTLMYLFWLAAGTLFMGEPVFPGWITPALPLTLVYLKGYAPGPEAVQAMTALSIDVGVIFLVLGVTGLGKKVYEFIPTEFRAAIIMGAAIAAFKGEFTRWESMPISLMVVYVVTVLVLYSVWFAKIQQKHSILNSLANLTILVGFIVGACVGTLTGELTINIKSWGLFIPEFEQYFKSVLPFYIGWPAAKMYIAALPLAFIAYVICFGDMVLANTLIEDAGEIRTDEEIPIDLSRTHYSLAIRNIGQIFTSGPHIPLHGPIFAGGTVFLLKIYRESRKNLDSIFEGTVGMNWLWLPLMFIGPVVFFFSPLVQIGLGITLIITGFACAQVAMRIVDSEAGRSYALLVGLVIAFYGPSYGLLAGFILYFLVVFSGRFRTAESAS